MESLEGNTRSSDGHYLHTSQSKEDKVVAFSASPASSVGIFSGHHQDHTPSACKNELSSERLISQWQAVLYLDF